jgi:hypothetical protein
MPRPIPSTKAAASVAALVALTIFAPACAHEIDTSRTPGNRGTTGEEIFGVLCDRLLAQALREDLTGASFRHVCHKNEKGEYADDVDESFLPAAREGAHDVEGKPVSVEAQTKNRDTALTRIRALIRRRGDLIEALDATFPDVEVEAKDLDNPDPAKSCSAKSAPSTLGHELSNMLGRMGPLYGDDTIPHSTESLARLVDVFATSKEAQETLVRLAQRKGYRPPSVALGAARPLLGYPRLRDLSAETLRLTLADSSPFDANPQAVPGAAYVPLSALMMSAREEMRTATVSTVPASLTVTADALSRRDVLSRPRETMELLREVLFTQDASFGSGAPRYIVKRDARGLASVPLVAGAVPKPFVDKDGDGLPDVDDKGSFLTVDGSAPPTPFFSVDAPKAGGPRDTFGRLVSANRPVYEYMDTSHVFLTKLITDSRPLVDPEQESLMNAVGGLYVMLGKRDPNSKKTYAGDPRQEEIWKLTHRPDEAPPGDINQRPVVLGYNGYSVDSSPALDLVYAAGQLLSDHTVDDALLLSRVLMTEHQGDMARLLGATIAFRDVANAHPEAQNAHGPYSTFWDEMLDVVREIAKTPGFLEDLIRATGDDETVQLGSIFGNFMKYRDRISYDRNDLNGRPYNLTTKRQGGAMQTKVDRDKPDLDANRSAFHRFIQAVHDAKDVTMCNKAGAIVHAAGLPVIGNADICYSSVSANSICNFTNRPFKECEVFKIDNLAKFYLGSIIGESKLTFRPNVLRNGVLGQAAATVGTLQLSSGITGFWDGTGEKTFRPKPEWLNRLVFFDFEHDNGNGTTMRFLRDLQGPHVPSSACDERVIDDPIVGNDDFYQGDVSSDRKVHGLRTCQDGQYLEDRNRDATFALEQYGLYEAITPMIRMFFRYGKEDLLIELMDVIYRHWQATQSEVADCAPSMPKGDPRNCSLDGLSSYEALISEGLAGDLFASLHDTTKMLDGVTIPRCKSVDSKKKCTAVTNVDGVTVVTDLVRTLIDVDRARQVGLSNRKGDTKAHPNDGSLSTHYVTPIDLLAEPLNAIDLAFVENAKAHPEEADRQANWQKARSQLVDVFLKVKGSGKGSQFANPAVTKLTPMLIDLLRSQLYAHCSESLAPPYGKRCAWAKDELPKKAADMIHGPLLAAGMDLMDAVRKDEPARKEFEQLMQYMLSEATKDDALTAVLTSAADMMQVMSNDEDVVPIYHLLAEAAGGSLRGADGKVVRQSMVDAQAAFMARLSLRVHDAAGKENCSREIDPNEVMKVALKNMVTPLPGGTATEPRETPLEVFIDVISDVNRVDPAKTDPLGTADYEHVAAQVSDFLLNKEHGLEQLYEIMRNGTM